MKPRLIKSDTDHKEALARIDALWNAEPETPEGEELELLLHLVDLYESQQFPIPLPDPIEAIKFRMEQQGLKRVDIAPLIGGKSRVSEVLNRKRPLSLTMIRRLHQGLGIPADILLNSPNKGIRRESSSCPDIHSRR